MNLLKRLTGKIFLADYEDFHPAPDWLKGIRNEIKTVSNKKFYIIGIYPKQIKRLKRYAYISGVAILFTLLYILSQVVKYAPLL